MTKIFRTLIIASTFLNFLSSAAQVQKVKVKKDAAVTRLENDTCNFSVVIAKDIANQKMILHSLDMEDSYEQEASQTSNFQPIIIYVGQNIDVNPTTIQSIFLNVCKINSYKLKTVTVTRHKTTNPAYKNRAAIFLTYSK